MYDFVLSHLIYNYWTLCLDFSYRHGEGKMVRFDATVSITPVLLLSLSLVRYYSACLPILSKVLLLQLHESITEGTTNVSTEL